MFCRHDADFKSGTVVTQPSVPHYSPNQPVFMVDVCIKLDDVEKTYSIPENLSLTYAGDWCIATECQDLLREVELLDQQAEKSINDVPRLEEIRERCAKLKLDLNPSLKERKENDERIARLESSVTRLTDMFAKFMNNQNNA